MNRIMNVKFRRWAYGVSVAGFGVLGVYGIVDADQMAAWAILASAVAGLALINSTDAGANNDAS